MSGTLTPILKMTLPPFDSIPWDQAVSGNFSILDAAVGKVFNQANFIGVWKNSTAFVAGQVVFDSTDSSEWTCLISNTSAATGTFAADRTAHPTFWGAIAGSANDSAKAAAASATAAANSATLAAQQLNAFKAIYYGAFNADPLTDPLGGARTSGDLYFNTVTNRLRVWNGTQWFEEPVAPGVPEAPLSVSIAYGRQNGAWQPVVRIAGDHITGNLSVGDVNQTIPVNARVNGHVMTDLSLASSFLSNTYLATDGLFRYVAAAPAYRIKTANPIGNPSNFGLQIIIGTGAFVAGGNTNITTVTPQLQLDQQGSFNILGSTAAKTGAGQWVDRSDARIKNIVGPYPAGLEQLLEMLPQMFTYKGNDNYIAEDGGIGPVVHPDTTTQFIGLIAQDCEPYMPELVSQTTGYIDNVLETDIRVVDPTAVMYALVNAVKELNDRLVLLETP